MTSLICYSWGIFLAIIGGFWLMWDIYATGPGITLILAITFLALGWVLS